MGRTHSQCFGGRSCSFCGWGEDAAFHIIYSRLASDQLLSGSERPIVTELPRDHPYALFIFSNQGQDGWHFINVKHDEQLVKRRLFRRITVSPAGMLRTASERISLLDLGSMTGELFGLSPLAIQSRRDEAFDVELVTKAFYKELANWYFRARESVVFPKDAKPDADGKPSVHLIRLIIRLIFCWFLRVKKLQQHGFKKVKTTTVWTSGAAKGPASITGQDSFQSV
jgi:hypothetical protein